MYTNNYKGVRYISMTHSLKWWMAKKTAAQTLAPISAKTHTGRFLAAWMLGGFGLY